MERKEIKEKPEKEETQVQPDKMVFRVKGVHKVKQDQEAHLDRGDFREILAKGVRLVLLDLRDLQGHQEYKAFKA